MRATDDHPTASESGTRRSRPEESPAVAEALERAARRLNRALHRLALSEREAGADLRLLAPYLEALSRQISSWATLQCRLHAVLASSRPFRAALQPAGAAYSPAERQALLQNWRLCQQQLDDLADFADRASAIGLPFRQDRFEMTGERWAVEPIALRLLIEDALKDSQPDPDGLLDLTDELQSACQRLLESADRGLRDGLTQLEAALGALLDGLD